MTSGTNLITEAGGLGEVGTRGLTRTKKPKEVFGRPTVDEVWELAQRFDAYAPFLPSRLGLGSRQAQ
jgi:hypothetical protein